MKRNFFIGFIFLSLIILISCISASKETKSSKIYSKFYANEKYGLIDANLKIVVPAIYDKIEFNEVYLCKSKENGYRIYDKNLKLLYEFESEVSYVRMISPDLYYYTKTNHDYMLKLTTNKIIEKHFYIEENNNSNEPWLASRSVFYSNELQEADISFYRVHPYRNNRSVVTADNDHGYGWSYLIIDGDFNTIVNGIRASADYYSEGLIPVILEDCTDEQIGSKSFYIDIDGNIVYTCDFEFKTYDRSTEKNIEVPEIIGSFNEGVAVVQRTDKSWVILDREFNHYYLSKDCEVANWPYEGYSNMYYRVFDGNPAYSNGMLLVNEYSNGYYNYGFVDKKCNLVIPCIYEYAEPFDGPFAIVINDGVDGIVDTNGNFIAVTDFK